MDIPSHPYLCYGPPLLVVLRTRLDSLFVLLFFIYLFLQVLFCVVSVVCDSRVQQPPSQDTTFPYTGLQSFGGSIN